MVNFPVLLGTFRLAMAPVLLSLAVLDQHTAFLVVLVTALLSDSIDGPIARHFDQQSPAGARLDTCADISIYFSYLLGACWLWPGIIRRELPYILILVSSILLPALAGLIKFRAVTGYHTWLAKIASVCIAASSLLMFIFGPAVPFRVSTLVCLLAGIEEFCITLVLNRPDADVRSLWHVLRKQPYR